MADDDTSPHSDRPESVMIKLTRMEGKLDNLTDKINDLRPRVDAHGEEITGLCLRVQSLEQGAIASVNTAEALAKALREAKETAEGTARDEAVKAATEATDAAAKVALGWSPVTKVFAVLSALLTFIVIYQALVGF